MARDGNAAGELRQLETKPNSTRLILAMAPVVGALIAAAITPYFMAALDFPMPIPCWWLYVICLPVGCAGAAHAWRNAPGSVPIVFDSRAIRIPGVLPLTGPRWHQYSDLFYLAREKTGAGRRLVLCFRTQWLGIFAVHEARLSDPAAFDELDAVLDRALRLHPEARSVLARGDLLKRMLVVPWLGIGVALCLVAVHVAALQASDGPWPWDLLRFGASSPWLVTQGEWFRVVTANLLHFNAAHLAMNLLGLLFLTCLLEGLLGRWRSALVSIAGGGIGIGASALWGQGFATIGVSGAVMGLSGCCLFSILRYRSSVPLNPVVGVACALLTFSFLVVESAFLGAFDSVAHVTGFASGVILCACIVRREDIIAGPRSQGSGLRMAVIALALLMAVATGWGVSAGRRLELRDLISNLLEAGDRGDDAKRLVYAKGLAWIAAMDERTTMEDLENARLALERALEAAERPIGAVDALAAVEFLLGRHEPAEQLLRAAVEREGQSADADTVSRLAWYAWTNGTRAEGSSPPALVEQAPGAAGALSLESPIAQPKGLVVHILVLEKDQLLGLLAARFGAFPAGRNTFAEGWGGVRGDGQLSYRVTYVTAPEEALPAGTWQWHYWPWDPQAVEFLAERAAALRASAVSP